jgi:sigma-E factor negative regulatory protein RseA
VLTTEPAPAVFQAVVTERGVMLRDPQIEEFMAAHRQHGSLSALQMPAGFLRNATYDVPQR